MRLIRGIQWRSGWRDARRLLSAYEKGWFDKMLPELKAQIKKGEDLANLTQA